MRIWKYRWIQELFTRFRKRKKQKRKVQPFQFRWLPRFLTPRVEYLEDRTLPSISPSLLGQVATFTGTSADNLYLSVNSSGLLQYSTANSLASGPTSLSATPSLGAGLTVGTTYYYEITAIMPGNVETAPSPEVSATTIGGSSEVELSWTAVSKATGYNIYRTTISGNYSSTAGGLLTTVLGGTNVSYTDTGAAVGAGTPLIATVSTNLGAPGNTLAIGSGSTINVNLLGSNSTLYIDSSLSDMLKTTGATLNFVGGSGANLVGPVRDVTWDITGNNSGVLDSDINFTHVSNLTSGAGGIDNFVFWPGASLSGMVQGQSNQNDTLTVQLPTTSNTQSLTLTPGQSATAGSVQANGTTVVSFAGIKQPVNLNVLALGSADQIEMQSLNAGVLEIDSTNTTPAFGAVNVTLNAGTVAGLDMVSGNDAVTIDSSANTDVLQGGQIVIDGVTELWNNATSGTFTISATVGTATETTGPLAYNANAGEVQAALDDLAGMQVIVTGSGTSTSPWVIAGSGFATLWTTDSLGVGKSSTVQDGGAGNANSITALASANTWAITGDNQGTINTNISFINVQNLTGGANQDTFNFSDGGSVSGTVQGGGGDTTLDYSSYTSSVNVNFGTNAATGTGSAKNYNNVIGGSGNNTLTGSSANTEWEITGGANQGDLISAGTTLLSFSGFQNLTGAATNRDAFVIQEDGSITGTITGSTSGNDGLIIQNSQPAGPTDVSVDPEDNTSPGGTTYYYEVTAIMPGNIESLPSTEEKGTAPVVLNWTAIPQATGYKVYRTTTSGSYNLPAGGLLGTISGGSNTSFTDKLGSTVSAGTPPSTEANDNYTVVNPAVGGGLNTIVVNNQQVTYQGLNPFVSQTATANATIAGGEIDSSWELGDAATTGQMTITNLNGNFYNVVSNQSVASLNFAKPTNSLTVALGDADSSITLDAVAGPLAISINGGSGSDTLAGSQGADHTWTITGPNTGTVNGYGSTTVSFSNVGTLIGGNQSDDFVYANTTASTDGVDGGTGTGTKTLDYSAVTNPVNLTLGSGNANITKVIGGTGTNTLVGVADDNVWTVTGTNSGTVVTTNQDSTTIDYSTLVYTNTDTTSGTTPNSIVFPIGQTFTEGEQVTYVSSLTPVQDTSGLTSNTKYYVHIINPYTIQLFTQNPTVRLYNAATSGTYTLSANVDGTTELTTPLPCNASASAVAAALNALPGVQVAVTGAGTVASPWVITGTGYSTLSSNDSCLTTNIQPGAPGVQQLYNSGNGTAFTIEMTVSGQVVQATLAANATATDVQNALNGMDPSITAFVSGSGTAGDPWLISGTGLSTISAVPFGLVGGNSTLQQPNPVQLTANPWAAASSLQIVGVNRQLYNAASSGSFTITATVNGNTETTSAIAYNAAAADVQSALNQLAGVTATVTGAGTQANPWIISGAGTTNLSTTDSLTAGNNTLEHASVQISSVVFSGFANLTANGGNDQFILENSAGVTGTIDGGTGTSSVDYSAYTTPVTVNLGNSGAATTGIGGGILDIQNAIAPTGTTNTLLGPDQTSATWEITGLNSGKIDQATYVATGATLTGATSAGSNTITGLDSTSDLVVGMTVTGPDLTGGPYTIASIPSSTSITLNTSVGITSDSSASLTLSVPATVPVAFSGFANLTGAAATNDAFILRSGGSLTGTLNGGAGGDDNLAIENPASPGQLAILEPDATGGGTLNANQVYKNTSQITFAGLESPLAAISTAGGVTLQGSGFNDNLVLSQTAGVLTLTDANSFWDYSAQQLVAGDSVNVAQPQAGQTITLNSRTSVSSLNTMGANLVVNGNVTFTGDIFTAGGNITVNNQNDTDTITLNPNVIISTRQTLDGGLSGPSTGSSGSITFNGANINIDNGAELLSYDDRNLPDPKNIPLGIGNQSAPAGNNLWLPGKVYRNIATTANGSGTGLTVDVFVDTSGNPTVVMNLAGSGYTVGEIITIVEPNDYLTGSSSLHNGGNITVQIAGLQTLGGDITLSAYHHLEAISWSYNPDDVSITVSPSAIIKGRTVKILADADNNDVFNNANATPITTEAAITGQGNFDQYMQETAKPLVDLLINLRPIIGVALAEASATITLDSGSSIEALGGNVFAESFANSKAESVTVGLVVGFSYDRSDATATLDAEGNITSDTGSITLNSITGNSINSITVTINPFKLGQAAQYASVAGAVNSATSTATTTIGSNAHITAARDVNITAVNVKNLSTTVQDSTLTTYLGVSFLYAEDQATANATVDGHVTATGGNVDILAESVSAKDSESALFQSGQPLRSNFVNKFTIAIQGIRIVNDAYSASGDAASGIAALLGALAKQFGDKSLNDPNKPNPLQSGKFTGVITAEVGNHTNTATATVGGSAVIDAGGHVLVHANVLDQPVMEAQGLADKFNNPLKPTKPGTLIVAISTSLAEYTNNSNATVDTGAAIDAGGDIDVAARTSIPYDFPWTDLDTTNGALTEGDQIAGLILEALGNSNLGANLFFSSFTQSSAKGNKTGFALSDTLMELIDGANASIQSGALINQATPITQITSSQNVSVSAISDVETVNLVGNFPQILDAILGQSSKNPEDTKGANAKGIGGSFSGVEYNNTIQATIGSGAQVNAYNLTVNAQTQANNISLGVTGAKSGTTSVNGAANVVYMADTTLAQIGQGATIATKGTVDVTANDTPLNVNLAGGVSIGTSVGFGITVGTNVITRNTQALIGSQNVTLGGGEFTPGAGVNAANNTIDLGYVDGFQNGDQVVYSDGGDDQIDGLIDGSVYYVGVINPTTIVLGRTAAEALASADAINGLADPSAPKFGAAALIGNNELNLGYVDGFQTGDGVVYNDGGGTNLGGLTNGQTYYVIAVNATDIKLAASYEDALSGQAITLSRSLTGSGANHSLRLAVNPKGNTGFRDNIGRMFNPATAVTSTYDSVNVRYVDGFTPGQAVVYSTGGDPSIGGLTNNTVYYVIPDPSNPDAFQLAATKASATSATPVVLPITPATGLGTASSGFGALIDPSSDIDTTTNELNLGYTDGFTNGQAVIYSAGGGTAIGGLTDGDTYYVTVIDDTTIQLSTSATNLAGTIITLDPNKATGTQHSLRVAINPETAVTGGDTTTVGTINLGYTDGFTTGEQVYYSNGGGTSIGGLANKNAYYVIVVNPTTIRLADSLTDAQRGNYIDLDGTAATGSDQSIGVPFQAQPTVNAANNTISVPNAYLYVNGQAVVYHNGGGTSIGGLTDGHTYYVTVVDATDISLSTDPSNLSGTIVPLNPTVATGTAHTLSDPAVALGSLSSAGKTTVHAENDGLIVTATLAAAKVGDPPKAQDGDNAAEAVGGQKTGQAVSGSVSVNVISDTTEAEINNTTLANIGGIEVSVKDDPLIVSVSGAAAISTNSSNSAKNVGLAGAVTVNIVRKNETDASIQNSPETNVGAVSVTATDSSRIVAIAAGLGGSSRGSGIAGSASANIIDAVTNAYITGGSLDASSLTIKSSDATSIVAVAGSLAYGGKLGFGAGIAYNEITDTADAYLSNTSGTVSGALSVDAENTSHITAVGAGIAVVFASPPKDDINYKPKGLAVAVGLAINSITADMNSYVAGNGSQLITAGSLSVTAEDTNSTILAVSGGVAVGLSDAEESGAAAGAGGFAFAFNNIYNSDDAYLDDAVINSGTVDVSSSSTAEIDVYAIGGAVAGARGAGTGNTAAIAGAGSFTFNNIKSDVIATIRDNSSVTTTGTNSVTVTSLDHSTIQAFAGGFAIAAGFSGGDGSSGAALAVGASVAENKIEDNTPGVGVEATIDDSTVSAGGNIDVEAIRN